MSNQNPLNLTENETKLYNTILVSGQLNFGEVRAVTRMTIEDLQIAITSLINKGLIREVPGLKGRYAALLPVGNLKSALDETATSIRNAQKDLENASESLVTKFQEDMHASSRALLAKIDETAASSQSNFESMIEDQNQRFTSLASEVIAKTESVQTVNDTEKDRIIDDLKKQIATDQERIASLLSELTSTLIDSTGELKSSNQSVIGGVMDEVPVDKTTDFEITKAKFEETLDTASNPLTEDLSTAIETINQSIEILEEKVQTTVDGMNSSATQFKDTLNTGIAELKTSLTENIGTTVSSVDELQSTTFAELNAGISELNTKLDEINTTIEASNQQLDSTSIQYNQHLNANHGELKVAADSAQSAISEYLTTTTATYHQTADQMKSDIQQVLDDELSAYKSKMESQFQTILEDMNTQFTEFQNQIITNLDAKVIEVKSGQDTKQEELSTKFSSVYNSVLESQASLFDDQKNVKNELFDLLQTERSSVKENISSSTNTLNQKAEVIRNEFGPKFDEINTKLTELSQNSGGGIDSLISQNEEDYSSSIIETMGELRTALKSTIDEVRNNFTSASDLLKTGLETTIASMKAEIAEKFTEANESLERIQDTIISNFKASITQIKEKIDTHITINATVEADYTGQLQAQTRSMLNDVGTKLEEEIDNSFSKLAELIGGIQTETNELYDTAKQSLTEQSNVALTSSLELVEGLRALTGLGTEENAQAMQATLTEYNAKYSEVSRSLIGETLDITTTFDNIQKIHDTTETPKFNTTHIIGKRAIVLQMEDLISRVKSKVTILVPDISMINDDQILSMKRVIQVTIISYIDEVKDKNWIDKMHGAEANVTLRSLTKSGLGAELPDFIGCEREGEEIILGTLDDSANEFVAITSASEYFVQILGGIVIADYARGKSRQLKKA